MLSDYPDTSNAPDRGMRKLIEPGMYDLVCRDIWNTDKQGAPLMTKDNRFEKLLVVFDVVGTEDATLIEQLVMNPEYEYYEIQLGRLKQMLTSMGLPTTGGKWSDLKGRKCRAMVKVNGQYNNIHWYATDDVPPQTDPADVPANKNDVDLPF
jgi:hypothetical protein